jgi:hypothetical protein
VVTDHYQKREYKTNVYKNTDKTSSSRDGKYSSLDEGGYKTSSSRDGKYSSLDEGWYKTSSSRDGKYSSLDEG